MITIDLSSSDLRRIIDPEKYGFAVKPARVQVEKKLAREFQRMYPDRDDFSFIIITETGIPAIAGYYEVLPEGSVVRLDVEITFDVRDFLVFKISKNPFNSIFS